ncbi:hypothetical protein [Kribbella italica]|uniref:Uncharacterized protein n=1 Tax=Kribbella italica TaxID=1540520 RepID=A0A7W9JF03_9ACTN|nr:hypothetical protein [Kribbella italica]MBB5840565.1 hypothetical protein [Kribbella italica]
MNHDDLVSNLEQFFEPQVVCWKSLDPAAVTEELAALQDWVTWAVERYQLDHKVVLPCWAEHGNLVEELSALRSLWEACFQEDASPSEPITFHRELDLALRRLREWSSRLGCSRTSHRADQQV